MMQVMVKNQIYHCQFCHKDYRYRGEVTGCSRGQCCHGADILLTSNEVWKEYLKNKKKLYG